MGGVQASSPSVHVQERARRGLEILLLLAAVALVVLAIVQRKLGDPAFQHGVVGLLAAAFVAAYASGDGVRQRSLGYVLAATGAVTAIAVALDFIGPRSLPSFVTIGGATAGLIALALFFTTRGLPHPPAITEPNVPARARLRTVLLAVGAIYALDAIWALAAAGGLIAIGPYGTTGLALAETARSTLIAGLCLVASRAVFARIAAVDLIIAAIVIGLVLRIVTLGGMAQDSTRAFGMSPFRIALIESAFEITVLLALFFLSSSLLQSIVNPRFLSTTEYRALTALADVIVSGQDEAVPPEDVARNVDRALAAIRAHRLWVHRAALFTVEFHPLMYLKPRLSVLSAEARLAHLKHHFQRTDGLLPEAILQLVQAGIRVAKQLTYVGYYNDARAHTSIGYVQWENRPRYATLKDAGEIPDPKPHGLRVEKADQLGTRKIKTDVCVIGSGAAGAVIAHDLAKAGHSVTVLERGAYVEPRFFDSDEIGMIGKLYADGVFQQTTDFRFTVLQGSCVGGSTVVNNAVSFRTPDHVVKRWNQEFGAGLDPDEYSQKTGEVEQMLSIVDMVEGSPANKFLRLNPSAGKYLDGIRKLNIPPSELRAGEVRANIAGCYGCGYCNIGCRYGKKLSMLETTLPKGQQVGDLRIIANAEVERIEMHGDRAVAAIVNLPGNRKLRVEANKFVLSAGAVASSLLLLKSGFGDKLPVGKHASFNMGAPITADFKDRLDSYDGLQISHFGVPDPSRGFVFETWYNPPVSQALNMPGWFEDHFDNMKRYTNLMAVGVLVGTDRNGTIKKALTGGADIKFTPQKADLAKLGDGLVQLGRILFAAGATRVMVNGWKYHTFTNPDDLAREVPKIVQDKHDITLGTGHPQGGNAMSTSPQQGVVDQNFRVHGTRNLFVCDASVIPSSLTVNPQLTVMSLAHYASNRIAS